MQLPPRLSPSVAFTASPVSGAGRGKKLNVPTINVDISSIPPSLHFGVYACLVSIDNGATWLQAAVHYGPRPVFNDSVSFEIHILDAVVDVPPALLHVQMIAKLRDVRNFSGPEELKAAIANDISQTRAIVGNV